MADSGKIEAYVLNPDKWVVGSQAGASLLGKHVTCEIHSLSLEGASEEQRAEALGILKEKYEIDASITHSRSMGGVDVIRVGMDGAHDEVEKFKMARHMANPAAWRPNTVTTNGIDSPALNLRASNLTDPQIAYAQALLKKWDIDNEVKVSQSLGDIKVIRIEGKDRIQKLRDIIPSLAETDDPERGKGRSRRPPIAEPPRS